MSENENKLNFYIPGRPAFIYFTDENGVSKCYRKTEERSYDGRIFDEAEVDRTSTTRQEFFDGGLPVWVQRSCEECNDPTGNIQIISLNWVGSTIDVPANPIERSFPPAGDAVFTISPFRNGLDLKSDDDHVGPGLACNVTMEDEADSFANVFGAIAPVIVGSTPPEVGFTDPLSATDGMYTIDPDLHVNVTISKNINEFTTLPGHKDWDYNANPLDIWAITPMGLASNPNPKNPSMAATITLFKQFDINSPQPPLDTNNRLPTEPVLINNEPALWLIDGSMSTDDAANNKYGHNTTQPLDVVVTLAAGENDIMASADLSDEFYPLVEGNTGLVALKAPARNGLPAVDENMVATEDVWMKWNSTSEEWEPKTQYVSGAKLMQKFTRPNGPPISSNFNTYWLDFPDR